jgi:Xaa-Pro aminopeptidase
LTTTSRTEPARRVSRLQAALRRRGLDAMIVFDRRNVFYLTEFSSSLSYLIVTPDEALLLVDGRYIEAARQSVAHCEVRLFKKAPDAFGQWARRVRPRAVALEGSIPWAQWKQFAEWVPGAQWSEAGALILDLRLRKSAAEIRRIQASARLNDLAFEAALAAAVPGATELDLRHAIRRSADDLGAEGEAFDCIVATGASGSKPHYTPSDVPLRPGQFLLIDLGMRLDGYCSDMTRVVAFGGRRPPARLMKAYEAVLGAEEAALAEVGPGVRCRDLHALAVSKLKRRGLDRYFTHSLGHGLGLDVHEAPAVNATSETVLQPGMVITIEPGVYLPRLGGVRIEDLVVVTKSGHRVLSRTPKAFRTLPFGS